jgi:hypothetical protein
MEWTEIWRVLFCDWDGRVDRIARGEERLDARPGTVDDPAEAAGWVRRQIQDTY